MKFFKVAFALMAMLTSICAVSGQERRPLSAQEKDKYIVSSKAWTVNAAQGDVTYRRGENSVALIAGHELDARDLVRTGANGRAEILLNPGAYLRVSENTEFVLVQTKIGRLALRLLKGSAIVEASVVVGWITVVTPKAEFAIVRAGLYRFDVAGNGRSEAVAHKGEIVINGSVINVLGGRQLSGSERLFAGNKITIEDGAHAFAKIADKKSSDAFDAWSKARAKAMVAANKKLRNKRVQDDTGSMLSNVWVYDHLQGCYTFLPGFYSIYSVYGYRYEVVSTTPYGSRNLERRNSAGLNNCCDMIKVIEGPRYNPGGWNSNAGYPGSGTNQPVAGEPSKSAPRTEDRNGPAMEKPPGERIRP